MDLYINIPKTKKISKKSLTAISFKNIFTKFILSQIDLLLTASKISQTFSSTKSRAIPPKFLNEKFSSSQSTFLFIHRSTPNFDFICNNKTLDLQLLKYWDLQIFSCSSILNFVIENTSFVHIHNLWSSTTKIYKICIKFIMIK